MTVNNIGAASEPERAYLFQSIVSFFCKKPDGLTAKQVSDLYVILSDLNPQWRLNFVELCYSLLDAETVSGFPENPEEAAFCAVSFVAKPDFLREIGPAQVDAYLRQIFEPQAEELDIQSEMCRVIESVFRPLDEEAPDSDEPTTRIDTQSPPFAPPPEPVEPAPVTRSDPPVDFSRAREQFAKGQEMMLAATKLTADANRVVANAEVLKLRSEIAMGRAEQRERALLFGCSDMEASEMVERGMAALKIAKDDPLYQDCLDMGRAVLRGAATKELLARQYQTLLSESDGLQRDIRAEDAKILVLRSDSRKRATEGGQLAEKLKSLDAELVGLRKLIGETEGMIKLHRAKHKELTPLIAELQDETERLQDLLEESRLQAEAQRRTTAAGVANAQAEIGACKRQEAAARAQFELALAEQDATVEECRAALEQAKEVGAAERDRLNGLVQKAYEETELMRTEAKAKILSGKEDAGEMSERLDRTLQNLADLVGPSER